MGIDRSIKIKVIGDDIKISYYACGSHLMEVELNLSIYNVAAIEETISSLEELKDWYSKQKKLGLL